MAVQQHGNDPSAIRSGDLEAVALAIAIDDVRGSIS